MEYYNLKIHDFVDFNIDGKKIPVKLQKELKPVNFSGILPVVLRTGAIDHRIGFLKTVRIGRDQIFGDIQFEIDGQLEFEPMLDEGKVTGIMPTKLVLKKENPSG